MTLVTRPVDQLDREIATHRAEPRLGDPAWERAWSDLLRERYSAARMPTIDELARAFSYIEYEYIIKEGRIDGEQWAEGLAFGQRYAADTEDLRQANAAAVQLSRGAWLRIAERANHLARDQGEAARYLKGEHTP